MGQRDHLPLVAHNGNDTWDVLVNKIACQTCPFV